MSTGAKSTAKAVLLSALVCPGAGQLYLRRYIMASLLLLITLIALVVVLIPTVTAAQTLAEQLLNGDLQADSTLQSAITATAKEVTASVTKPTYVLVAAWIIGVAHAWYFSTHRTTFERQNGDCK